MTFSPITLGSGLSGFNYLQRTRDAQQALFDQSPIVTREVEQAAAKLQNVQTSDALMDDRNLLRVALGAFGLDEDIDNKAFIKRILDSDLDDRQSLANRLTDKRYLAFAETFNFQGDDGPKLPNRRGGDELTAKMDNLATADDLLSDRSLLRASLERFGLAENVDNTYFLTLVLESDLSDPTSFANTQSDERLVEFAEAFDFHQKGLDSAGSKSFLDEIVDTFDGQFSDLTSGQDLIDQPEMLENALNIFGLDNIYSASFIESVLDSDLNDEASVANTQDDPRMTAFAAAFNFATPELDVNDAVVLDDQGDPVLKMGNLENFLNALSQTSGTFETPDDILLDRSFREATFNMLGIPQTVAARGLAERVLESDPNDPGSFAKLFPDDRFKPLTELFTFTPAETTRTYPEGFVDQVVRNYLDRQFEIQVGEVDPDMRVALSLERELTQVTRTSGSNDAQWFSIMSSPPLRQVFEGAFRLPSSFGSIDIDQQLSVLKDRADQFYGTSEVAEFLEPETLDTLRQNYLISRSIQTIGTSSDASIASAILSNF